MSRTQLDLAVGSLQFARQYTKSLLEDLPVDGDDWFAEPPGSVTHLAWQVGHLAMAEYALTMLRIRGKEPEDQEVISNDFFRRFKKGTQPTFSPGDYPPVSEILAVLDRVHNAAMTELGRYTDADLEVKLPEPHAVFDTKLGSIFFCADHEMLHAGQIGLTRRLLGKPPVR